MARVADVIEMLKNFAPEEYVQKDEHDNVGLLVGRTTNKVKKVLCCLDVTQKVIDEAIDLKVDLIVSHHPVIFYPISSVTDKDVLGRKILSAIENGISIYAAHTNLDFVEDGINDYVAKMLGLIDIAPLDAYISDNAGFGRIGKLPGKITGMQLKKEVQQGLNDNFIRVIGDADRFVSKVAIINGGGGGDTSYVDMAVNLNADCLITADVKHHVAVYAADLGLLLIEPQHYTMEHVYIARLVQILKLEAKSTKANIEIIQSKADINPRT